MAKNNTTTKVFKTIKGICEYCGKEGQVWSSSDCHETGGICTPCAKKEGFISCRHCGDMRAPENLQELDPAHFTQFGKYCPGCLDEVLDELEG